jgi:hypothetical protein
VAIPRLAHERTPPIALDAIVKKAVPAILVAAAFLLLQSCGATHSARSHTEANVVQARSVTPNARLEGLVAIPWERARTLAGGRRLRIFFHGGASRCGGLKKVAVRETRRSVVVTLFQGHVSGSTYCPISTVQQKKVNVHLPQALGDRKVKDGESYLPS